MFTTSGSVVVDRLASNALLTWTPYVTSTNAVLPSAPVRSDCTFISMSICAISPLSSKVALAVPVNVWRDRSGPFPVTSISPLISRSSSPNSSGHNGPATVPVMRSVTVRP